MPVMLLFTSAMFIWQTSNSIKKLQDPPVIDTTEILSIDDIDLPVITFCSSQSWNETALERYGYGGSLGFMVGSFWDNEIAWGAQWNMTFRELLDACTNLPY